MDRSGKEAWEEEGRKEGEGEVELRGEKEGTSERGREESAIGRAKRMGTSMSEKRGWKSRVSEVEIGGRIKGYGCRRDEERCWNEPDLGHGELSLESSSNPVINTCSHPTYTHPQQRQHQQEPNSNKKMKLGQLRPSQMKLKSPFLPPSPPPSLPLLLFESLERTLGLPPRLLDTMVSVRLMPLELESSLLDDGNVGGHGLERERERRLKD